MTESQKVKLSVRQTECLELIAAGATSGEIAAALRLSVRTVDHYIGDACAKLGVRSRAQAVALAISLNMVPPPTPR